MAWTCKAAKNRYLNFSALQKFATTQNEPKGAERN